MSAVGLLALLGATACSGEKDQVSQRLDKLHTQIVQLRAANLTLQDRLDALEDGASTPREGRDAGVSEAGPPDGRPRLRVIRLGPEADPGTQPRGAAPVAPPPGADDPAVVLRLQGGDYPPDEEPAGRRWSPRGQR